MKLNEIKTLVERFEQGSIPESEWHHLEHLIVGLWYIENSETLEIAVNRMREGILNYLRCLGVDTSKESPYHETLTVAWMQILTGFSNLNNEPFEFKAAKLKDLDKDLPLRFYSRELLFSENARKTFVPPDIAPIRL